MLPVEWMTLLIVKHGFYELEVVVRMCFGSW